MNGTHLVFAQDNSEKLKIAIEQKAFSFYAKSINPMKGGSRQLNPGYLVTVKGDSLISRLPYFGRVYQTSIGEDGGYNFESHDFSYQVKDRKKGGWNVTIKTRDQKNQRQLLFTVSPNGSTTLNVTSNDRESISYFGTIEVQEN